MVSRDFHRIIVAALLLLLSACGNNRDDINSGMSVAITDAPACGIDHLYLTIQRVRVNENAAAAESDPGWVDITPATPPRIDLLSLSNGLMLALGQTQMPVAAYQQLHLELASNSTAQTVNTIVPSGGSEQALDTLDMPKDGLTLVAPIAMRSDAMTEVVLDFDVCRSVVQRGDGSYALRPAISSTQMQVSGGIAGYVDATDAGASVYAEINGNIVKGTRADSTGRFVLAPIPDSSTAGNYDVVVVQDGHASAIITGVPVTAGASTVVASRADAILLPASAMRTATGTALPATALATVYAKQQVGGRLFATQLINANADTGAWGLRLAAGSPLVAVFGPLPLGFLPDDGDAGHYLVSTVPVVGTSQNLPADVSAGDATGLDTVF